MLLLHLSDFHFGRKSRSFGLDAAELSNRLTQDLRGQLTTLGLGETVDVVVVTGDLTESGSQAQFEQAGSFLRSVARDLGLAQVRFVILPGNHDVSWAACRTVENEQEEQGFPDAEREERIRQRKLAGFGKFVADFYAPAKLAELALPLAGGGWLFDFDHLGLSVAALNSCEKETHRPVDRVGFLSRAQTQSLLDLWLGGPDRFRVIALHHPPVGVTKANVELWTDHARHHGIGELMDRFVADLRGIEGSEELKVLAKQVGAQLVLHGHQSVGDTNHWADGLCHVLSAGSLAPVFGEQPPVQPLSFGLIELEPGRPEARAWSFVYSPRTIAKGRVDRGAFDLDKEIDQPRTLPIRPPGMAAVKATSREASKRGRAEPADLPTAIRSQGAGAATGVPPSTPGTTVAAQLKPKPSLEVFISYSHKDEALRAGLEEHLVLLNREGSIKSWSDRKIMPGQEWAQEIDARLETAGLILLLVSSSFIASPYCYETEMNRALERQAEGTARVVPILLRPCDWQSAPFGRLQALPFEGHAVTKWRNRDEAWHNVVKGIRRIIAEGP